MADPTIRFTITKKQIASYAILAKRLEHDAAIAPTAEKRRSADEALRLLLADIVAMKADR